VERGDLRAARLAANEAVARRENEESIQPDDERWVIGSRILELECECAHPDCGARLTLTNRGYAEVRTDALMFLVAPGHERPDIEEVVHRTDDFLVVRKLGVGKEVAEQTDPRS
jgi:hypothetical protein